MNQHMRKLVCHKEYLIIMIVIKIFFFVNRKLSELSTVEDFLGQELLWSGQKEVLVIGYVIRQVIA